MRSTGSGFRLELRGICLESRGQLSEEIISIRLPPEEPPDHTVPKCMAVVPAPREVLVERVVEACLDQAGQGLRTVGRSAGISKTYAAVLGTPARVEQIPAFRQLERMGGDIKPGTCCRRKDELHKGIFDIHQVIEGEIGIEPSRREYVKERSMRTVRRITIPRSPEIAKTEPRR